MIPLKTFTNLSKTKQERITRIAVEEFGEKGYAGASINAIVKRLGIAKGSIFQYFGDKKGLFLFAFDTAIGTVKDYLRTTRDQTVDEDLFTRLEATLLAGVFFLENHPAIFRLYTRTLFEESVPFRNEILMSLREYSHKYLRSLLETARERGEIRDNLDLDKAGFMLDAIMDRFLQAQTIRHLDAGLGIYNCGRDEAREWISQLTEILRMGIGKC
jgi:AcrR family transcriptional regulator